jgi:peptide chain release factor 2
MEQLKKQIIELQDSLSEAASALGLESLETDLQKLRSQMGQPDFWKANLKAQEISKKEADLARRSEPWRTLADSILELRQLAELDDESMKAEIARQLEDYRVRFKQLKKELRFSGPHDDHDVILSIYAGAGGTDAGEHGVHRLVRRSPFNSAASRETSFAKVDVLPLIDNPGEIELDDKDLKIDVYRAGGHGGQSVNTTDSAVRVTHIPTRISVAIQNERSQLQNKETALGILRSRLAQLQQEQHAETLADIKGPNQSVEFGSQIRNYILDDPIIKDLRTGYETHDPQKILDGNLDPLIDAWLERL